MPSPELTAAQPIPESELPGPYPVGMYAAQLKRRLLEFARVQLVGEVWGFRSSRARVYFELRDARGALPCSMWTLRLRSARASLWSTGCEVVIGGGCDYYPGSASSSPSFSFAVSELRIAGEGDLLVQLERLRRRLHADGLFEPQKRLRAPAPARGRSASSPASAARPATTSWPACGAAAGPGGWCGRSCPCRTATRRLGSPRALRELAAIPEVEVVIVARGGGSLADLFAFCDEALCRTVALLRVPVISSVGHHTDRTLIDDVAAVCCSTPTHAAEAAVPIDCNAARADLAACARRLHVHSTRAISERARTLERLAAAPAQHVMRQRRQLHQLTREMRASARRAVSDGRARAARHLLVLGRSVERARTSERSGRERELQRLALALAAHDPERTLARGYALVEDRAGDSLTSADAARAAHDIRVRFHDGAVEAEVR